MNQGQILIVDDESIVRRAVSRMLAGLGYEVVEASCGNDAIQLLSIDLRKSRPLIKVVCLDWLMPRGSGRDVLKWKEAANHPAAVLIMTAYGSNQITREIEGFRVAAVMTKPFDSIERVKEKVRAFL